LNQGSYPNYKEPMKRFVFIFIVFPLILGTTAAFSQDPPHPPGTGHGIHGNQQPGSSAQLEGGISILIAFALAYGYRRINNKKKVATASENEEEV